MFKTDNKLNNLVVKGKDKLSKGRQHNVIYYIKCKTKNCKKSYIGRTTRALEKRVKEHKDNCKKPPDEYTVVTKHRDQDHEFDWERVLILVTVKLTSTN